MGESMLHCEHDCRHVDTTAPASTAAARQRHSHLGRTGSMTRWQVGMPDRKRSAKSHDTSLSYQVGAEAMGENQHSERDTKYPQYCWPHKCNQDLHTSGYGRQNRHVHHDRCGKHSSLATVVQNVGRCKAGKITGC